MAVQGLQAEILRLNDLKNIATLEISNLQDQKSLATYAQADANSLKNCKESEVKKYFRALFEDNEEYQEEYSDYTQIVDYKEAIDKITAACNDELAELSSWEAALNDQITTDSEQIMEYDAYIKSYKSMLQGNIQNDFKLGMS